MKTRRIGCLEVSILALGTNNFGTPFFANACDQATATGIVHAALDAGVTLFDTAEYYSTRTKWGVGHSEEMLRIALGNRRNDINLSSKFLRQTLADPEERGYQRVMTAIEGSLKRLGTDRLDLYQQHHPMPDGDIEDVMEALDRLVQQGKVREIGHSNFTGAMMDEASAVAERRGFVHYATSQNQLNLLDGPRHEDVVGGCERNGVLLLPYFPLASGLLTGKYSHGRDRTGTRFETDVQVMDKDKHLSDERLARVERLAAFAEARGHSIVELALSWLAGLPFVGTVISGASTPEQMTANAAAANAWELSEQDYADVAAIVGEGR
jgi:aryl-alcohol dehydrogenase-like predicted oxidoreductase